MNMTSLRKQVPTSHRSRKLYRFQFNQITKFALHKINNPNEEEEKFVFASDSTFSKDSNVSYHSKKSCK
jgi:hypothetical protein